MASSEVFLAESYEEEAKRLHARIKDAVTRIKELEDALKPFAAIKVGMIETPNRNASKGYFVSLREEEGDPLHFTRHDLLNAKEILKKGKMPT